MGFDVQIDDPLAKLVLLAIANNHNEAHDIAWPSAHLCHVTRASERTAKKTSWQSWKRSA